MHVKTCRLTARGGQPGPRAVDHAGRPRISGLPCETLRTAESCRQSHVARGGQPVPCVQGRMRRLNLLPRCDSTRTSHAQRFGQNPTRSPECRCYHRRSSAPQHTILFSSASSCSSSQESAIGRSTSGSWPRTLAVEGRIRGESAVSHALFGANLPNRSPTQPVPHRIRDTGAAHQTGLWVVPYLAVQVFPPLVVV